ncbi:YDL071C-like protein [Saccharomyces kudriavzevii IFO 1802]|uniref:YDL071C-like protein n=1 Tax=Saccharomyces kudriavzevii (strain ATCC MYA-4449 / AS 2.2408 / CBS 8840 / NBRC 1802 / NCYC 2889) TaxID=226230 RepID=J8TWX0_SACK1|nr:YDL071C-like protein [Saccharomyces kudriavzevii IFO 1802]
MFRFSAFSVFRSFLATATALYTKSLSKNKASETSANVVHFATASLRTNHEKKPTWLRFRRSLLHLFDVLPHVIGKLYIFVSYAFLHVRGPQLCLFLALFLRAPSSKSC